MTPPEAWLRVVLYDMRETAFDHFDSLLTYMHSNVEYFSTVLEKHRGFTAGYWGVDLDEGKIAAVTHWESLQAIQDAAGDLERLQADAEVHGIHRMHVQNIQLFPLPGLSTGTGPDGTAADGTAVPAESWLRVVTYQADAADGHARGYMLDHIQDFLRVLEQQPGFLRGYWGRDLVAGTMAAVTFWASRRAIVSARPALQRLQVEAVSEGVRPVDVRNIHLFAGRPRAGRGG